MALSVDPQLEARIREVADKRGLDPASYLEEVLRRQLAVDELQSTPELNTNGQSLDQGLTGVVGVIHSGGSERLSERASDLFGAYLDEKRRKGNV